MSMRPTFAELFVNELRAEGDISRRFIARVPEEKLDWKPHEKSHSAGMLAMHVALLPGQISNMATQDRFAVDGVGAKSFVRPASIAHAIETLDAGLADAEARLSKLTDANYRELWTATLGGEQIMSMPRHVVIRSILFSHTAHHRGQLGVYLRMLGVNVPYAYGPSADEMPPFLADRMRSAGK